VKIVILDGHAVNPGDLGWDAFRSLGELEVFDRTAENEIVARAREAEIAYATMAMVTDYDCWKADEAHVTVEMVIANLNRNAAIAKEVMKRAIAKIPQEANWPCHHALKNAIMTDRKLWPAKIIKELGPILKKYL